jgi:endonuclease YncB( thermonuclease family)
MLTNENSLLNQTRGRTLVSGQANLTGDYDADTFSVNTTSGEKRLRLLGLDAPETSHKWYQPDQAYGQESKRILNQIMSESSKPNEVFLRLPGQKTYGRDLAEVFIRNKEGSLVSVNQELIKRGAAYIYDEYSDNQVATKEIKKEYQNRIKEALVKAPKEGLFSSTAVSPQTFRRGGKQTVLGAERNKASILGNGITNDHLAPLMSENSDLKYLLPSQYGASYFFEKGIHNAMRQNAGAVTFDVTTEDGFASAAYRMKYIATHNGETSTYIPWYAKQYDKEMSTPGLSYYINEWAIKEGYGRLYKEESGALGSMAGMIGSFLDKSLTYYNSSTPDFIKRQQEISNGGYLEPQAGFFQQTLTFATNFAVQSTASVLTYFMLGVPYGIVTAELFKTSTQSLLDFSLSEEDPKAIGVEKVKAKLKNIGKPAAATMSIGIHHAGKSGKELKEFLTSQADEKGEVRNLYKASFNSMMSYVNLVQNQRAGIYFDNAVRPFIEDIINPYSPKAFDGTISTNWKGLQTSLNEFREAILEPAYIKLEGKGDATKFIFQNAGYDKAKLVAQSLDALGNYLPANPVRWGWLGHNYTDPKNEIINGKVIATEFVKLSEVFNFTDLLSNLEKVYYGGEYLKIVNTTTRIDETSTLGRATAKVKSALGVPTSLMGKAKQVLSNVYSSGFAYLQGKDTALGNILTEHKKLRKIESDMLGKAFYWNDTVKKRGVDLSTLSNSEVDSYLNQLVKYNKTIDPHRVDLLHDAVNFFKEEQFAVAKVRNPYSKLTSNWFLNNRKNIGMIAVGAFAINAALGDLLNSSGSGVSLVTQAINAIMHRELGATPEFTATSLFNFGGGWASYAGSISYNAFAVATGMGVASLTQGVNRDIYHVAESTIAKVKEYSARNAVGAIAQQTLEDEVLNNLGHKGKRGTLRPGGNFLSTTLYVTTSLLAARAAAPHIVAGALNIIRSVPFLGEFIFGNGDLKLNEKFTAVSKLQGLRKEIINRMQSGQGISPLEASAALQIGVMTSMIPLVDKVPNSKDVSVVANQSPMPYFQFFTTEVNKGKQYNDAREIVRKGTTEFKFGLQSAPLLGTNIIFSMPFKLNWDSKNKLGVSVVYANEKDNVLNYLQSIGGMGANALLFATTVIGTLDAMDGALSFFNKDNYAVNDIKEVSNMLKTSFKTFYNGLELLVAAPSYGLNFVNARFTETIKFTESVVGGLLNRPPKASQAVKKISWRGRIGRGALGFTAGFTVTASLADVFSEDQNLVINVGLAGGIVSGFGYMFNDKLSSIASPATSKVSSVINPIQERITKQFKSSILSKIPFIPKRFSTLAITGLFAGAAWMMTDSTFGVSEGMDRKYDYSGNYSEDWAKKLTTVGLYTAVMATSVIKFSDFGKSPLQILESYANSKSQLKLLSSHNNPLAFFQSKAHSFNTWKQSYHVRAYLDKTTKYIYEAGIGTVDTKDLAEAMKANNVNDTMSAKGKLKQAVEDISGAGTNKLDKLIEGNSGDALRRVFQTEQFVKYSKNTSFARKLTFAAVAFGGVTLLAGALVQTIGSITGDNRAGQQAVNAFYNKVDGWEALGNTVRLLTWKDKKGTNDYLNPDVLVNEDGSPIKKLGFRLLNPLDPQQQQLQQTLKNLMAPFVISPSNQYQTLIPGIGITAKSGEFGVRLRPYAQQQSALQDTSFAIYSTLPAYMFKMAAMGNRKWQFLIEDGMKIAMGNGEISGKTSPAYLKAASMVAISTTAQLNGLSKPRKYSNPITDLTMSMVAGDGLLSMSLRQRMRRTSELSYQPYESIASRMSDTNDFSIMRSYSNRVNINNPLSAANLYKKTEGIEVALLKSLSKGSIKDTLREIFAAGNRVELTKDDISVDKTTKEVSISANAIEDPSEWLEQTGSMYLDESSKPENAFALFGKIGTLVDSIISKIPGTNIPAVKLGGYLAVTAGVGVMALGGLGAFLYNTQQTRFKESGEFAKGLFGKTEAEGLRAFHVNNRVIGPNASMAGNNSFVINGRGTIFTIEVPDGISLSKENLNEALQSVMVSQYTASNELRRDVFTELESDRFKWDRKLRGDVITELRGTIGPIVDNYVDKIFLSFTQEIPGTGAGFGQMISSNFEGVHYRDGAIAAEPVDLGKQKAAMREKIMKGVETTLEEQVAKGKFLSGELDGDALLKHFKGYAGKEAATQLAASISEEFTPIFKQLDTNLYFLEPEDALGYGARVSQQINKFVKESGEFLTGGRDFFKRGLANQARLQSPGIPNVTGGPSNELLEELDQITPSTGRYRRRATTAKAGALLWDVGVKGLSVTEGIDFFSGFVRTAAYQSDPNRTEGEVNYAAQGTAMNLLNSSIMMGIMHVASKSGLGPGDILSKIGSAAAKRPGKAALAVLAATALVTGIYTLRTAIREQWDRVSNSGFGKALGGAYNFVSGGLGTLYEGAAYGIASGLVTTDKAVNILTGGFVQRGTTTALIGGVVGGVSIAFGLGLSLPAIGVAAGIGLLAGAGAALTARSFEPMLTSATNWMSKVPGIGGFLSSHSDQALDLKGNQYIEQGSPISSMTAGQAMAYDKQRYLLEAADYSGQRTKSLFSNPTMYGYGYRGDEPGAKMFDRLTKPVMDSFLDREATVKAQYYNQTVIGSSMWAKMIYAAENYNDLKQITQIQRMAEPTLAIAHKRVRAQSEADIKKLQSNITKKGKGQYITENETSVIVAIHKAYQKEVDKPNEKLQTTILIPKGQVQNKKLQEKVSQVTTTQGPSPVVAYNIKAEKDNKTVKVSQQVSSKNDILISTTGSKVNAYNSMPGYGH